MEETVNTTVLKNFAYWIVACIVTFVITIGSVVLVTMRLDEIEKIENENKALLEQVLINIEIANYPELYK